MRVFSYCMESVAGQVRRATGTYPVTCPPFTAETFNPKVFEAADFIWLGLHGTPNRVDALYGDEISMRGSPFPIRLEALYVSSLEGLDLGGKLVYAATCYLPDTEFGEAFKKAGAKVIGGAGVNYGSKYSWLPLMGVEKLGSELIKQMQKRPLMGPRELLERSKKVLRWNKADNDAKEFYVL